MEEFNPNKEGFVVRLIHNDVFSLERNTTVRFGMNGFSRPAVGGVMGGNVSEFERLPCGLHCMIAFETAPVGQFRAWTFYCCLLTFFPH